MNMNDLAVMVSEMEGSKVEINIAQIKEVLKTLQSICANDMNAMQLFLKYLSKKG